MEAEILFKEKDGKLAGDARYPVIDVPVFQTNKGTPYLTEPGVAMIAGPKFEAESLRGFLESFGDKPGFTGYLNDPDRLKDAEALSKTAGQLCYMSFGEKRTWNADAGRYFKDIKESGHGSVIEHANFSFILWGISRSLTHELVRHRAGMAYSQLSQRYVGGQTLRFVERPEWATNNDLHDQFENRIDRVAEEYEALSQALLGLQKTDGQEILYGESTTDRRKKVRQAARSILPNETETVITATGNTRAWRHVVNMRASEHAEVEIREAMFRVYLCLVQAAPLLFEDMIPVKLPDGTWSVKTAYPKV